MLTQLKDSINSLKISGIKIEPQVEESVENLQVVMEHLQEKSRDGTLKSDKDRYALLHNVGAGPGNKSSLFRFNSTLSQNKSQSLITDAVYL